ELFAFGIFAVGGSAFTGSEAADVYPDGNVTVAGEIRVDGVVARGGGVVFAGGEGIQQGGGFLVGVCTIGRVESGGQPDAVADRDPVLNHANAVSRLSGMTGDGQKHRQDREREQKTTSGHGGANHNSRDGDFTNSQRGAQE